MTVEGRSWGRIAVGSRLGKGVPPDFVMDFTQLVLTGMRKGDKVLLERGKPAHWAANSIIRRFLETDCDSLLILDDDASFEADFLHRLRDLPEGQQFDMLQPYHNRRGWPPEAIWFKYDEATDQMLQCVVTQEGTEEVGLIGTHCALIRREVLEAIRNERPEIETKLFEWFCYPRHEEKSDEATLSLEARRLGFKLGATTRVKLGHLTTIVSAWETYQEYLRMSGTLERYQTLEYLARLVSEYTGEGLNAVLAKALQGQKLVHDAWLQADPQTAEEERKFYQTTSNYFYDLCNWNATSDYTALLQPLGQFDGKRCLVIGAGLGNEAMVLARRNQVDVFELPGKLKDFCQKRLKDSVTFLEGEALWGHVREWEYDLVVAIDTLEHVHPDEFMAMMLTIHTALKPGGVLYAHNTWDQREKYPMHHDNSRTFDQFMADHGYTELEANLWQKSE